MCIKSVLVQLTLRKVAVTGKLLVQIQNFQHHVAPCYSAVLLIYIKAFVGPKDKKLTVLS